jgi:hypothetical protein
MMGGPHLLSSLQLDWLHVGYAHQLESLGLWVWGVFVLQHISAPSSRNAAIATVLDRHCRHASSEQLSSLQALGISAKVYP